MYPEHIRTAAQLMAENMAGSEMPLYGASLRLPDRKAVIALIKTIRQLMFPAYYGDAALMTLAPQDYAALLLDRIESQLKIQIALALPAEDAPRAEEIAREFIECLPPIPPSIRVFSNESALRIRWPKYWSFSFHICPSNEHPGLISFRMDWLDC